MCVCCISSGVSEPWAENEQLPADPEIVRGPYKSMGPDGIHPRILKELLMPLQNLMIFDFFGGNPGRSQLTGRWWMLSRFSRRATRRTPEATDLSVSPPSTSFTFATWRFFPPECSSAIIIHCYFFSAFHLTVRCLTSAIFLRKKGKLKGYS